MTYVEVNEGKTDFRDVYDRDTPTDYFREMGRHDYQIPETTREQTLRIIANLKRLTGKDTINILDIGSSYGVNALVLKYDQRLRDLYSRYDVTDDRITLLNRDREMYAGLDQREDLHFFGFDVASNALNYALDCGIMTDAWSGDFEGEETSKEGPFAPGDAPIDMILSTGCIGYVSEKTIGAILEGLEHRLPAIVVSYVLRMFSYGDIEVCLSQHGYETAVLPGRVFAQRKCASAEERRFMLDRLNERGIDPTPEEEAGYLQADLYISWTSEIGARMEGATQPEFQLVDR